MRHSNEIRIALEYIENNLTTELSMESISSAVGYSKFYFHRTFRKEVGISLYDFIRKRRLAMAAALLINTDTPIIEIALAFHFETQESFTRAFKSIYQLPPGNYRLTFKNLIKRGLSMNKTNEIKGWLVTGSSPEMYKAYIDNNIFHMGTKSATIRSISDEYKKDEFGTIMQQISAKNYICKRVCFSGFVKTLDVKGWCGLWFRIDDLQSNTLKIDNMQNRPITGTSDWNHYTCVLDVPESGALISIGLLLQGEGQAWIDNVSFYEVDKSIPITEFDISEQFNEYLQNPTFEEE